MHSRILVIMALLCGASTLSVAQIRAWTTIHTGDLHCDFPKGYQSVTSGITHSQFYQGNNMLLAVTAIADTFPMKGSLERDYSRDFAEVVLATSRKIQGRVREYRDTVIGNMPGYISRQEIRLQDGDKAYYDLVLVLHGDSICGFSSQFVIGDQDAERATARFFQSIRFVPGGSKKKPVMTAPLWFGGGLLVLAGVWFFVRRSKLRKH